MFICPKCQRIIYLLHTGEKSIHCAGCALELFIIQKDIPDTNVKEVSLTENDPAPPPPPPKQVIYDDYV